MSPEPGQHTATVSRGGEEVAATTTDVGYSVGLAHLLLKKVRPGKYTIDVSGDYAVSDPDTLDSDSLNGRVVFTQATQLRKR